MTTIIIEVLLFIISHKDGYTKWKGTLLSSTGSHDMLLKMLRKLNNQIIQEPKNHEIMKTISRKSQNSLEEENVMRWWDETFAYPKWVSKTKSPKNELIINHTIPVTKQTILLWNYLEISRSKF
jgi:hypothetical protein